MSYLILSDFKKLIQSDNLSAIIGSDYSILDQAKASAQTQITSYLTQKYDCSREFTDTAIWLPSIIYKAQQRIYLDAPAYIQTTVYNVSDVVLQAGSVYICITAGATGTFDPTKWTLLGTQYAMFFVTPPQPLFLLSVIYSFGDLVFWKDKVYTCAIATSLMSHGSQLQFGNYASIPPTNIFPDDTIAGAQNWGNGTAYSVAAGTLPTNATKWTAGDNRNQQLVNCCVDVALFTVHSRIAPRNIPDLRVKRYDDVIKWLKDAAKGDFITADLPVYQPKGGARIRWGSDIRKDNNY